MSASIMQNIFESTAYKKFRTVLSLIFHYFHKKFLWGIFKRIDEKFFKFLFVGFLNTVVSYLLYAFFVAVGLIPNLALFFQYILGVLWNFKTTGVIVFKNHNNKLIFKFIGTYIITFFINSLFLNILAVQIGLNEYLSQAILVLPVALLSFLLFKFWVFKE